MKNKKKTFWDRLVTSIVLIIILIGEIVAKCLSLIVAIIMFIPMLFSNKLAGYYWNHLITKRKPLEDAKT